MNGNGMLETVKEIGYTKILGEHSLSIGELVVFAIGLALIFLKPFGSWSVWIGLAAIAVGMALF